MPKFRVEFARTVLMVAIVEADTEEDVEDPGYMVYPDGAWPQHVVDVVDDETVWSVTLIEGWEEQDNA